MSMLPSKTSFMTQSWKLAFGVLILASSFFIENQSLIPIPKNDIPQWRNILTAIGASFLFVLALDGIMWGIRISQRRRFHKFFGGYKKIKLVYPDFILSEKSLAAIDSVEQMGVYAKKNPRFTGKYFIDLPHAVAANDLQGAVIIAPIIGMHVNYSLDLIADGEAVTECENSLISFGLTSNDITYLYLASTDNPLFQINDEDGVTCISIKNKHGYVKDFGQDESSQHGIILKHTPYPKTHPDIVWFICGGLKAAGTPAAAWHLAHNWNKYHDLYAERDFLIIFKTSNEIAAYRSMEVIEIISE